MNTRVLVVDDNPANVRLAEFLLTSSGVDVRTASDAANALAILEVFRPHLILMDIQLPGIDGLTFTRQLRLDPAMRDIRIVAMTSYAMAGDADRARRAGCDGYLSKPIVPTTFVAAVLQHLNGQLIEGRGV